MSRMTWTLSVMLTASLLASCSKAPAPEPRTRPAQESSIPPLPSEGGNVFRGSLTTGGMDVEYAAQFDAGELTRIIEHRRIDATTFEGEYRFKGARLLHYTGAKLAAPAELELGFDMQGVLQSGSGPDVSEAEIRAIRDRAQLLRSLVLAQRASRMHQ